MEHMNDHVLKEVHEYPELDFTPNYPWVGAANELDQLPVYAGQDIYNEYPVQAVGSGENEPWRGNEEIYGALGQLESSEDCSQSSHSRWRRSDDAHHAFDDPDFELPEDNSMYA